MINFQLDEEDAEFMLLLLGDASDAWHTKIQNAIKSGKEDTNTARMAKSAFTRSCEVRERLWDSFREQINGGVGHVDA
jgi:hypothetical protein